MAFTSIDKRLVKRQDQAFQEKYLKDMLRHTPDTVDEYETVEIEHEPICLYDKKRGIAPAEQDSGEGAAAQDED